MSGRKAVRSSVYAQGKVAMDQLQRHEKFSPVNSMPQMTQPARAACAFWHDSLTVLDDDHWQHY